MLLNTALVVLAASAFYYTGSHEVTDIAEAHRLLPPILGASSATVFAIMLLAAGQSATITGTLAGQVVMDGFIKLRLRPWIRRLITRLMALIPALVVIMVYGEQYISHLMITSQVFLSLQLPFAMVSLLLLTSDKNRMGMLVNNTFLKAFGWIFAIGILVANLLLIVNLLT